MPFGKSWNTIIDGGMLQYAPWRWITSAVVSGEVAAMVAKTQASVAYRPEQWSSEIPATCITDSDGNMYFFDAVLRIEHTNTRRITEHPVQTGANISDHSFQLPARVILEIGMSDVMDSYEFGQWDFGNSAKSVNAYRKLRELEDAGLPLAVTTRLADYENMVIENIFSPDDFHTKYGLKVLVTFKQIITATVAIKKVSLNENATGRTPGGFVNVQSPKVVETSALKSLTDYLGYQ